MTLDRCPGSSQPAHASPHRGLRRLAAALALPIAVVGTALIGVPAAQADGPAAPGSLTVHYSDGAVVWTVPTGTYEVSLTAVGGSGADGDDLFYFLGYDNPVGGTPGTGGRGAVVTATIPVVPGERLHLEPGSAAPTPTVLTVFNDGGGGRSTGPFAPGGTGTRGDNSSGRGGGGGAATVVRSDSVLLAVAGGGGGGGGTGTAQDGGAGGNAGAGGAAAPGPHGGSGGSDLLSPGSGPLGAGGSGQPNQGGQVRLQVAGGAGGGGGGWDGSSAGGGSGGEEGTYQGVAAEDPATPAGGGGGGAGGPSFAIDPTATVGLAPAQGDGWLTIGWTPGVPLTSTLSAPDSVQQGTPVTLTDVVAPAKAGLPAPTGTVTFEQLDIVTRTTTVLGRVPVTDGRATLVAPLVGVGAQAVHGVYSGDGTYLPSTTDYAFTTVVASVTTVSATPASVAFGNVVTGTTATRTVTLTNTGTVPWAFTAAGSDNPAVSLATQPCATLAPGASCTATLALRPTSTGPVRATLTLTGSSGSAPIAVAGTGIPPAPVITGVSPASGSVKGGTRITLTGRNFTGVTSIRIAGVALTSVSCPSATKCTAVTPRSTAGAKDVRVSTAGGTSAVARADRFTYR